MLPDLNDISSTNVNNGTTNTLGRFNNNVVVLAHVESIEFLDLPARYVEYTLIDCVRDAVVDELGKDQTILTLVEHFESVGGKRKTTIDIGITSQHGIDVAGELSAFILVDSVSNV